MSEFLSRPLVYPIALALISLLTVGLEAAFKWRKGQRQLRGWLWSDLLHLVFNGHFLGVIIYGIATHRILPHVDHLLAREGWTDALYRNAAADWPTWVQIVVALFVIDFLQWCVHNLLHRVPLFWEFHKTHHSVVDGEMDWIVAFRFQWTEVVVYRTALFVPLAWFGFGLEAIMFHAIFGTLIGHLNHANLQWDYGPLRYLLNSPKMHIWHHDYEGDSRTTVNFGIIFSLWDWIFGTAKMPGASPARIGFPGVERFPRDFFRQMAWPLGQWLPEGRASRVVAGMAGVLVIGSGYALARPPPPATPMLGERASSSRPSAGARFFDYPSSVEEADRRLAAFGTEARKRGHARPDLMVSAHELAGALGSGTLAIIDVRPRFRFEEGHIPSAQSMERSDYSLSEPVPGVSKPAPGLQALLRERGVDERDVVVLYGDGGPEPYRLWWTLRTVGELEVRILDGGLAEWMAAGHGIAEGAPQDVEPGDITLPEAKDPILWSTVAARLEEAPETVVVDTRSAEEFIGAKHHRKAARAGRIPGARHLDWWRVWRDGLTDQRLRSPQQIRALAASVGVMVDEPVVTMCQSGTRSSVLFFALLQAGFEDEALMNYDGSWAEYSRLSELPLATGDPVAM